MFIFIRNIDACSLYLKRIYIFSLFPRVRDPFASAFIACVQFWSIYLSRKRKAIRTLEKWSLNDHEL